MEHISEVVKILDAALMHDTDKAMAYANLLADKLDREMQPRQARAVRSALARLPSAVVSTAHASARLPTDSEHDLAIVDYKAADELEVQDLVLHPYVESRIGEFLKAVEMHDQFESHGVAPANRLLIYGPPGTGKTSIAAMIARSLDLPLVVSRSDALVSSLLGQTSRNIRNIFEYAESSPCVLFLDEFDALAKDRNDAREIGELQRVVIALLQNIDSLSPATILVAATNHPELLDTAIWRRFDFTLKVDLPGALERERLWSSSLGVNSLERRSLTRLVELSDAMSAAAIKVAANDARRVAIQRGNDSLDLHTVLRRLARVLWYDSYERFASDQHEMLALREWAPDVFTIRVLADEFDVSTRQVTNAVKGADLARV
jgi:SpoVK/Ycf46/Vps4 family AAA+-type ATPase